MGDLERKRARNGFLTALDMLNLLCDRNDNLGHELEEDDYWNHDSRTSMFIDLRNYCTSIISSSDLTDLDSELIKILDFLDFEEEENEFCARENIFDTLFSLLNGEEENPEFRRDFVYSWMRDTRSNIGFKANHFEVFFFNVCWTDKQNMTSYAELFVELFRMIGENIEKHFCDDIPTDARKYMDYIEEFKTYITSFKYDEDVGNFKRNQVIESDKINELLSDLNSLIGLNSVKREIKKMVDTIKFEKLRGDKGFSRSSINNHFVFLGNPGTGKTTVARKIAAIFKELGVLSKGHCIDTDRAGVVAGYVGQTALKMEAKVQESMGGVLFIDEAYSLFDKSSEHNFGKEAIDQLLKMMEDNRDDLVVIVAGYPKQMKQFIESNPGLKSRFNKYIYFEDYNAEEMMEIFEREIKINDFKLSKAAAKCAKKGFESLCETKDETFANGRLARNIYDKSYQNCAERLSGKDTPSIDDIQTFTVKDIENAFREIAKTV